MMDAECKTVQGLQANVKREEIAPTVRNQKIRKSKAKIGLIVFLVLAAAIVVCAIIAPYLCPYDPYAQDLNNALKPPSDQHLLGTDRFGRDLLSRVIIGSQSSVFSALALVGIIMTVGTVVGMIAGWYRGVADTILMRVSDIFLAFPGLVFALGVAGALGGGLQNAIIAIAAVSWPKYARLARSQVLSLKDQQYIEAARISGCSTFKILVKHMLPNIIGTILVTGVLDIGVMIMEVAGLSFLGLGATPPTAEWGSMMSDGRGYIQTAPWVLVAPGIAIFITVIIFNLLGDNVRDYMDPKHRNK